MLIRLKNYGLLALVTIMLMPQTSFASTFDNALSKAYMNNPRLSSARDKLRSVDEDMPSAISGFLPSLTANHQRGRRDTTQSGTSTDRVTDSKEIALIQPLFKGGQTINSMKQANNTIAAERETLRNVEQEVLLEAITAYMDIVRDTEVLELSINNVLVLEKHLEATRERFELGEVTKTDVAQAEASLAIARSENINAEGALASSQATYSRVIGERPDVIEAMDNPVIISASLDEIIQMAMTENPSIKVARHNENVAKSSVAIEKGKLLPTIDLQASKDKQKGALFTTSDLENERILVNLSIPIYQSGSEYSSIRRAKFNYERLKHSLQDQKNLVREQVIRAYNDFKVARAVIKSNQAAIEASEVVLEGTEQEAKVGARTTLDVLDAEQDLFEAKANLIRSKRDEIVSSYTLLAQVGRLNAKELSLDVEYYDPVENYNKRKYQIIGF